MHKTIVRHHACVSGSLSNLCTIGNKSWWGAKEWGCSGGGRDCKIPNFEAGSKLTRQSLPAQNGFL